MPTLTIENLNKSFGERTIYQNISFTFTTGCYVISGSNGTGKSVLIEMLAGVLPPDSGSITLHHEGDCNSIHYKKSLTYIPDTPTFFESATGNSYLNFIHSIKSQRNDASFNKLISGFNLKQHLNTRFSDMSLGTQKKIFLTTLALGNRKLIIMDEPSNALDSASSALLAEEISNIAKSGIVIIATHDTNLVKGIEHTSIALGETPIAELKQYKQVI